VATPGLTAVRDLGEARRTHLEDALVAVPLLGEGPVADVGSGGGSPGIPLACARPDLRFDLLESQRRKCLFLEEHAQAFPNVRVVCARVEEHAWGAGREVYGTAVSRALAPPEVAVEWCLPLVRAGGRVLLFTGEIDLGAAGRAAAQVGGGPPDVHEVPGTRRRRLVTFPKVGPTPERFPRRPGLARKRPLA
jgi:16S rRNA (guanine527-N7)-methyltransferase